MKIYMEYFGYGEQDMIPCEWCGRRAVDVHHIQKRSQGGKNDIENLVGLCREHHDMAEDFPVFNEKVKEKHLKFMKRYVQTP